MKAKIAISFLLVMLSVWVSHAAPLDNLPIVDLSNTTTVSGNLTITIAPKNDSTVVGIDGDINISGSDEDDTEGTDKGNNNNSTSDAAAQDVGSGNSNDDDEVSAAVIDDSNDDVSATSVVAASTSNKSSKTTKTSNTSKNSKTTKTTKNSKSTKTISPAPTGKSRCRVLLTKKRFKMIFPGAPTSYYEPLVKAVSKAKWCTPEKLAAFLGTIKHETASLTILYQPIDNGAGCIHMIPNNWPFVFQGVSCARKALGSRNADLITSPYFDEPRFKIMTNPKYMFDIGVWWFQKGAGIILNNGCANVVQDMQNWPNSEDSFTMLKNCVFGFAFDFGDVQRRAFIIDAYQILKGQAPSPSAAGLPEEPVPAGPHKHGA